MAKYKLEYIWLDGKKPIPELRGKTNIKDFEKPPTLADMPLWGFDGSSTMQAAGKSSDCILKPVALYPDAARKERLYRPLRSHASRRHAAPDKHARHRRGRSRFLVRIRAGIFPLQRRPSAGLPRRRLSRPAGPLLLRRRLQVHGQHRPHHRRGASRALPCRRHQPRRHQRRGCQGPVGVPDLRQGLAQGRRRPVDRPLPDGPPLREVRSRLPAALQADSSGDWNGSGMHTNFSTKHLRDVGGKDYFEA